MRLFHFCLVKSVLIFYYCSVGNCVEKAIGEQLIKSDSSFTFDDSTLFKINFVDTTSENNNSNEDIRVKKFEVDGEQLVLTNEKGERYSCVIPKIDEENDLIANSNNDDTLNPYQLLKPLFTNKLCSFRVENYWAYELCHGKYIRQFHDDPSSKGVEQEFSLGTFNADDLAQYEQYYEKNKKNKQEMINVEDVQLPFVEINMTDGTPCDLFNKRRFTRVLYVCVEDAKHEIYSVKETSSCEYEVIAFSPLLCLNPKFKLKTAVENEIKCYPLDDSPKTPTGFQLADIHYDPKSQSEAKNGGSSFQTKTIYIDASNFEKEGKIELVSHINDHYGLPRVTDQSLINRFLSGEHCLTGGSGWWKYEFCYGKRVNQYHEEANKKIIVNLGNWNLEDHIKWIQEHPAKRPRSNKTPKFVSHFYSNGEICEKTKNPRSVEVKLKCNDNRMNADAVSLYLMEPQICEYILVIESPIICDLLSTADNNGLFQQSSNDEKVD